MTSGWSTIILAFRCSAISGRVERGIGGCRADRFIFYRVQPSFARLSQSGGGLGCLFGISSPATNSRSASQACYPEAALRRIGPSRFQRADDLAWAPTSLNAKLNAALAFVRSSAAEWSRSATRFGASRRSRAPCQRLCRTRMQTRQSMLLRIECSREISRRERQRSSRRAAP